MVIRVKVRGKCVYCQDPIYDFQVQVVVGKGKYHQGCYEIEQGGAGPALQHFLSEKLKG